MVPSRIDVFNFKGKPVEEFSTSGLRKLVEEEFFRCKCDRNSSFDVSKSFEEFIQNFNLCLTSSLEKGFADRDERPFFGAEVQPGCFKSCTVHRLMEIKFGEKDVANGPGIPFGYSETLDHIVLVERALENGVKKAIRVGKKWPKNREIRLLEKIDKRIDLCRQWLAVSKEEKRERPWRLVKDRFDLDLKAAEKLLILRREATDKRFDEAHLNRRLRGVMEGAITAAFQDTELFNQVEKTRFKRCLDCWEENGKDVEEEVRRKMGELAQADIPKEMSMEALSKAFSFITTPWERLEKKWSDVSEKVRALWVEFFSDLDKALKKHLEQGVVHLFKEVEKESSFSDENFLSKESLVRLIKESILLSCQDLANMTLLPGSSKHDSTELAIETSEGS